MTANQPGGPGGGSPQASPVASLAAGLLGLLDRVARADRWTRVGIVVVLVVASVAVQWVLYQGPLRNPESHATRFGVSAALGLLHGRGMTTSVGEALAVKNVDPERDLLPLYEPEGERDPAHEPMPGVILFFAGIAGLLGRLRLADVVSVQMLIHAALAAGLYLELRPRHPRAALLAGLAWALFVPQFRVSLSPGHDALTSSVSLASLLALLHFERTRRLAPLLVGGVLCGVGLWLRSYFFLLPATYAAFLAAFAPPRLRTLAVFLLPVVAFSLGLREVRRAMAEEQQVFVRGGVWHNFWTGVGQFDNPYGVEGRDDSVREFAERLAPGRDFAFQNYQYDPEYNRILAEAGRRFVDEHPGLLARNAVYRAGWMVVPATMPSGVFASSPAVRIVLLALGLPVVGFAIAGFVVVARASWLRACLLLAPWLALLPLTLYMVIAKVPTQVYFGPVALAAVGFDALLLRLAGRPAGTSAD